MTAGVEADCSVGVVYEARFTAERCEIAEE